MYAEAIGGLCEGCNAKPMQTLREVSANTCEASTRSPQTLCKGMSANLPRNHYKDGREADARPRQTLCEDGRALW